jgi:hypothetical protein
VEWFTLPGVPFLPVVTGLPEVLGLPPMEVVFW